MIINYEPQHVELEEEGQCNLVLVAIRYTGPRSSIAVDRFREEAAWPGGSPLQAGPKEGDGDERLPGPAQGALVPDWTDDETEDRTVTVLEAHPDIEVLYTPESIAQAMLEANYLDPNVFGQGFDGDLRDRVFEHLGLQDVGVRNEAEYRAQLREIAGIEADDEAIKDESRDDARVTEYRQEYTRQELITAAAILGNEDAEELGKIELATYLADQPRQAVRFAFEGKAGAAQDALGGDDVTVDDPLTAEDLVEAYDPDEIKNVVKAVRQGTGEFSLRGASTEDMAAFLVEDKELTEDEIDAHLME